VPQFIFGYYQSTRMGKIKSVYCIIIIVSLLVFLILAYVGIDHTLLGHHSYRKTQTALNTKSILETGKIIGYENPVAGPPWRITFEFPVYQVLTASVSFLFKTDLVLSGRLVSLISFLISLLVLYHLIRMITGPDCHSPLIASCLLLTVPIYRYWSSTVMIETTALAMSVTWLYLALLTVKHKSMASCALGMLFGTLAGLCKVTTFLIFIPCYLLLLAVQYDGLGSIRQWLAGKNKWNILKMWVRNTELWLISYIVGIPFVFSYCWVKISDVLKSDNPLSAEHTSSALQEWNFGGLGQRLHWDTWVRMSELVNLTVLHPLLILAFLLISFLLCRHRYRVVVGILVLSYLIPLVVFTNLYYVHEYYFCANTVFLIAALACGGAGIFQRGARLLSYVYVAALVFSLNYQYLKGYYHLESINHDYILPLARFIQTNIPEEGVMLIYGYPGGRNPELTYYSQRRSVMFVDDDGPDSLNFKQVVSMLNESDIKAVIFCAEYYDRDDLMNPVISRLGMNSTFAFQQDLDEDGKDWQAEEYKWKVFLRP